MTVCPIGDSSFHTPHRGRCTKEPRKADRWPIFWLGEDTLYCHVPIHFIMCHAVDAVGTNDHMCIVQRAVSAVNTDTSGVAVDPHDFLTKFDSAWRDMSQKNGEQSLSFNHEKVIS